MATAPDMQAPLVAETEEVHIGNRDRRVTVSMPKSLPELEHAASTQFGHGGRLRMYHLGKKLMYNHSHLNHLEHDDHIVVKPNGTLPDYDTGKSTHQSDFIRHPVEIPTKGKGGDRESVLSYLTQHPFDGLSRYKQDFIKHPDAARATSAKMGSSIDLGKGKMGETAYAEHFPWRELGPRTVPSMGGESCLPVGQPFEGRSSYTQDFVKQPITPQPVTRPGGGPPPLKADFAGSTTYSGDFTQPTKDGRMPSARPVRLAPKYRPLDGTTEYAREYVEKMSERSTHVHLEPHLKTMLQATSTGGITGPFTVR